MKKVLFITTPDARPGFGLAGIDQIAIEPHKLEGFLIKAASDPNNGLVVIDERLTAGMADERLREIERTWHGVVVILPSPISAPVEIEDYVSRLIRKAIGYHVRIRL
ncbi:MAG: ATPase [Nitrospirae bacterium]|nr:ATPase [Nitrospirota bacterium]